MPNNLIQKFFLLVGLGVLISCGSTSKKVLNNYDKELRAGNTQKALKIVEDKKFYPDEESKLLKILETATLHFLNDNYLNSLESFEAARTLSNNLFTKSISKKAKSVIASEKLDNYYGEIFERSLIRYYLILNYLTLSQLDSVNFLETNEKGEEVFKKKELNEKDRRRYLQAARAISSEWYSKSESWKNENLGDDVFKDDVLGRVIGAFAHESQNTLKENRVAKNLYEDAQKVLFKNYNIFKTFNLKSEKFRDKLKDFPTMNPNNIKANYIKETPEYKELENFLKEQSERLNKIDKSKKVFIAFEEGIISSKTSKKYYFPLGIVSKIRTLLRGKASPTDFLFRTLNIAKWNGQPAIAFELPDINFTPSTDKFKVKVLKAGKVLEEKSLALVNPLSEFAKNALEAKASALRVKIGTRLATKYAAAVISAVTTYKTSVSNGTPKGVAELLAASLFVVASKGIEKSEEADLRSWRSLPENIYAQVFDLAPDTYDIQFIREGGAGEKVIRTKKLVVENSQLLHLRHF